MPRFNAFRSKPDQADDKASAHERRFACRQWSLPFARLLHRTRATCLRRAVLSPFVPAKAGTQALALDSRLRGNERSLLLSPFVPAKAEVDSHSKCNSLWNISAGVLKSRHFRGV